MRLFLYRQDIQNLNSVSEKEALIIMRDIREDYKLPKKRYISINAYCKYFKVEIKFVLKALQFEKTA